MKAEPKRILIADDEPVLLEKMLSAARGLGHLADGAEDGAVALSLVREHSYNLVVTDIRMPHVDGLELIAHLRKASPALPFLAITGFASVDCVIACLRHGAVDFLVKPFSPEDFVDALTHALKISETIEHEPSDPENGMAQLTSREQEVLLWAKEGKNNWEISQILNITESTVKFHFSNIFRKLSVVNKVHAVAKALKYKLI